MRCRRRPAGAAPRLLVFGGSQGARVFNETMPKIVAELLEAVPGLTIVHQAGARQVETTRGGVRGERGGSGAVAGGGVSGRYAGAVWRRRIWSWRGAGSTVAELAAAGKPSLLVPFPQAADDHQRKNAEVFAGAGAAVMLLEAELTPERLLGS